MVGVEAGPDAEVARAQFVQQPRGLREPPGEVPDAPVRALQQPGARDPDRQRQARADRQHRTGRLRFGTDPGRADDAAQQLQRPGLVQRAEQEGARPVQIGQSPTARHQ